MGFVDYAFSTDMVVTIKSKAPMQCDNVYLTLEPHIAKTYESTHPVTDDTLTNIKLDDDGYYTSTTTVHMTNMMLGNFEFYYFDGDLEILDASGTITYNPKDFE